MMGSLRRHRVVLAAVALSFASLAQAQERAKELVVTFVEKESGKPIPGASASVQLSPGGTVPQTADAEGKLVVPMSDPKLRYLSVVASAPGRASVRVSWSNRPGPFNPPAAYTFALPKGIAIGGVVLDSEGQPVPSAPMLLEIEIDPSDLAPNEESGARWEKLTTDAEGKWSFASAPDKWKSLRLGAGDLERGGNEQNYFPAARIDGDEAEKLRHQKHELRLPPARQIVGRVVDANGKPIPGATVQLGNSSYGAITAMPPATTDPDGTFLIGVKPDATVPLTFTARGFAPELIKVTNTADLGLVEQTLQPAQTVDVQIVGPDGAGVAGANLYIKEWRGTESLSRRFTANGEGRITWSDAPVDAVIVRVYAKGFASADEVAIRANQQNVIKLQRAVTFHGKVIDAETKEPIAGATTDIGILFSKERAPSFRSPDGSNRPTSAADGTFAINFDEPYYGRVVRVEKEGYARADSPIVTMDSGDQSVTFELKRSAGMSGSIVDASGKPAAGITVFMATPGNALRLTNGESPEDNPREAPSRKTDEAGKFTLPEEAGDFALVATSPAGYVKVDKAEFKADQPIVLAAWSRIEGDIFVGSKPMAGEKVQAWASERRSRDAAEIDSSLTATADAAGHFVIDRVPPGQWLIGRHIRSGEHGWTITSQVNVDAKPGATQTIRIGGNGRPVVGRVEMPDDLGANRTLTVQSIHLMEEITLPPQPVSQEQLRAITPEERKAAMESPEWKAWSEKWMAAQTDQRRIGGQISPDGTFRFDDVPPAKYKANVHVEIREDGESRYAGRSYFVPIEREIVVEAGDPDAVIETPILELNIKPTR